MLYFLSFQCKHRDVFLDVTTKSARPTPSEQTKMAQYISTPKKYSSNDPRQCRLNDSLIYLICGNLVSFNLVDSVEFRDFVADLDSRYQVPSRDHLSHKLLRNKSSCIQNDLKQQLKMAASVCLTIDLWSNRQMKGFLGITGHYILDWTMKSVMIACKRFKLKGQTQCREHSSGVRGGDCQLRHRA